MCNARYDYKIFRFLRGELSCFELELMSSRSEIKVLLEELSTYKSGEESKEEFPDLLLSSLDKLYNDKQQQLWLVYDDKEIKLCYPFIFLTDFWDPQQH